MLPYFARWNACIGLFFIRNLTEKVRFFRIKRNQIAVHIKVLAEKGTIAGMPYMRHLDGEIWELRPIRDRILFAGVLGDAFVLLHSFIKKTQKTPKQEIEQAKRELQDFIDRGNEDERS